MVGQIFTALTPWALALEQSAVGETIRASAVLYPLANLVHLLGLVMLLGGIGLLDLRLIGLMRGLPPAALAARLIPIAAAGLVLMAISGGMMFAADAGPLIAHPGFRLKLLLVALAVGNALLVHLLWRRRIAGLPDDATPPAAIRLQAAASLLLWLWVAVEGRMIAYS